MATALVASFIISLFMIFIGGIASLGIVGLIALACIASGGKIEPFFCRLFVLVSVGDVGLGGDAEAGRFDDRVGCSVWIGAFGTCSVMLSKLGVVSSVDKSGAKRFAVVTDDETAPAGAWVSGATCFFCALLRFVRASFTCRVFCAPNKCSDLPATGFVRVTCCGVGVFSPVCFASRIFAKCCL